MVVDDDIEMRTLLCQCLREYDFIPHEATTGDDMRRALADQVFDLVVLDLALTDGDGLRLCREIRSASEAPLIVLTSRGEPIERIAGQDPSADDYIVKPFEPREFVARIGTTLRRGARRLHGRSESYQETRFGRWRLSRSARHLIAEDGTIVMLSNAEFRVLAALLDAAGSVLTAEQLGEALRETPDNRSTSNLEQQIALLRQKLGEDAQYPPLLVKVQDKGFMINTDIGG
jgi:two-component system OmpR family response regulator